ncbi:hypothetical protein KQH94_00060, partial [Vibrio cholerae]|uniref:hypothetical protein n=1 Tax=Vibrio cholerae TaxID=666 RepID=UPI001C120EB1
LAWAADENGVGILKTCSAANVFRRGFCPAKWRLFTVKTDVLIAGEKIHLRARHTGQALEVTQGPGINIDTANAAPLCLQVADDFFVAVEALGPSTQPTAEM